jgi:urease accessory protein
MNNAIHIGVGGPVGSGKTTLIEELVPRLVQRGLKVLVVTGDEDVDHARRALKSILPEDRIVGVREETVEDTDVVLVENGNADFVVHVIDVAAGDRIPRKGGPGISRSDILVVNKTDLAPYVDADLGVMAADAAARRAGKPVVFTNCRTGFGIPELTERIFEGALFDKGVSTGTPSP